MQKGLKLHPYIALACFALAYFCLTHRLEWQGACFAGLGCMYLFDKGLKDEV